MKQKLIQAAPLLATLLGVALAPASNWCVFQSKICYGSWIDHIYDPFTEPLYQFAIPAIVLGIVLPFVSARVFRSWLKFAAWALPVAFIWIAITPVSWTGLGINFYPYYRINAAHDAGIAFTVLGLLFIAWKQFKKPKAA